MIEFKQDDNVRTNFISDSQVKRVSDLRRVLRALQMDFVKLKRWRKTKYLNKFHGNKLIKGLR